MQDKRKVFFQKKPRPYFFADGASSRLLAIGTTTKTFAAISGKINHKKTSFPF